MRTVAQRVTKFLRVGSKSLHVLHLKCKVREIRTDLHGATLIEFANFDQFFALRGFEKDQLGTPSAGVAAHFFQTKNVFVEAYGFLKIGYAIPGMEEFRHHVSGIVTTKTSVSKPDFLSSLEQVSP